MNIEFRKVSDFPRGTLFALLSDAYSFDFRCSECWSKDWQEFDDFFYDNLQIADKYGFITTLNGKAIGLASWDPRNMPKYVEIGHNCIISEYKGNGYGKRQLQEAIHRIEENEPEKIIVTTSGNFIPAQRMYESVGFELIQKRKNEGVDAFSGEYIDYVRHIVLIEKKD